MFQTILSVTNKIPLYCTLHPAVYLTIFTCICSEELQAGCYACFSICCSFVLFRSLCSCFVIDRVARCSNLLWGNRDLWKNYQEQLLLSGPGMKRFLNRILFNTNKLSRTVFHHYPSFLTPTHAQRIFDWFCEYLLWSPRSFPWNLINQ